MNMDK